MIDFSDPQTANHRLSNAEREAAVASLNESAKEGRLTDAEAQERSTTARSAVTRGDLAPLFADLPTSPFPGNATSAVSDDRASDPGPEDAPGYGPRYGPGYSGYGPGYYGRGRPMGRGWGVATVSLVPFVALALFFISGNLWGFEYSWLWFLLIPIGGILVYGIGESRDRR